MAETNKRKRKSATAPTEVRPKTGRQAPKERVIELGQGEQGDERITRRETALDKEREAYRHGGIPIGSDPRE